jgi:Tfp pilus assembly protein PilF
MKQFNPGFPVNQAQLVCRSEETPMNRQNRPVTLLIFALTLCWLAPETAAQAKTSRAASAASYIERLAEPYGNRGLAWLMQDRLAEAEADFAKCRELGGTIKPKTEQLLREARERRARAMPRER